MTRPRVVMSLGASVDGKLALTRRQVLMGTESGRRWAEASPRPADGLHEDVIDQLRRHAGCTATLEGSGSLVAADAGPLVLPAPDGDPAGHDALYEDHLPPTVLERSGPDHMWFVAVDGRGRVRWTEKHPGWDELVLVCRATPAAYLAYLRREGICYLVRGDDHVDLAAALDAMGERIGIACVVATAGGALQGALLRAGLLDEITVTLSPMLVGGHDTPTLVDGDPLAVGEAPTALRLLSVHSDTAGLVRLRYAVVGDPAVTGPDPTGT